MAPVIVQVPVPLLTSEVVPVLSAMLAASRLAPALLPVSVSVVGLLVAWPMAPVLLKLTAPAPEESIVPEVPRVNKRSVVWGAEPVYCSVPPSTRFVAMLLDAPMLLFDAPLARLATLSVPARSW